jgi:hypothetical protein
MTKKQKFILYVSGLLILAGVTALIIRKRNKSTIEQFETFLRNSLKNNWVVLSGASDKKKELAKDLWLKKLNSDEAETLVYLSESKYPPGANTDIADKLIKKWGVESLNV